jgi:hypothetical protein
LWEFGRFDEEDVSAIEEGKKEKRYVDLQILRRTENFVYYLHIQTMREISITFTITRRPSLMFAG